MGADFVTRRNDLLGGSGVELERPRVRCEGGGHIVLIEDLQKPPDPGADTISAPRHGGAVGRAWLQGRRLHRKRWAFAVRPIFQQTGHHHRDPRLVRPFKAALRHHANFLLRPKPPARDARAFDQRRELRPDDRWMHLVRAGKRSETAIGAGDHALASDHIGKTLRCRCATSSGCSTRTVDCVITPGIRTLSSGSLARLHSSHSCSCRGLAASNE